MIYTKINGTTLLVTKPTDPNPPTTTQEYKIDFLKQQEIAILKSKNDYIAARDKELIEVRELLLQCTNLGIKASVVDVKSIQVIETPLIKG